MILFLLQTACHKGEYDYVTVAVHNRTREVAQWLALQLFYITLCVL